MSMKKISTRGYCLPGRAAVLATEERWTEGNSTNMRVLVVLLSLTREARMIDHGGK
jgi:hypothetical protein